jgi:hypothetical protein
MTVTHELTLRYCHDMQQKVLRIHQLKITV